MSSSLSHRELMTAAAAHAAPYTRRLAMRLGAAATLVLLIALAVQFLPQLQAALTAVQQAFAEVLAALGVVLSATAQAAVAFFSLVGQGAAALFVELCSGFGVLMLSSLLVVTAVWHRARTYIMQSAVELVLESPTSATEGQRLVEAFHRTQRRTHRVFLGVTTLSALEVVRSLLLLADSPDQAHWRVLAFVSLSVAGVGLCAWRNHLSPSRVAAYALFRGCSHLSHREFTELTHSRTEQVLPARLSSLRRSGLLSDKPFAVKEVLSHARRMSAVGASA